jgi:hypothetical protein
MNISGLIVTLLSITFVDPNPWSMCKDSDCNLLYTPSQSRLTSCECNKTVHTFMYPKGYNNVYVNYSMTYPISHEFYQDNMLVGSCPTGLWCLDNFTLDPKRALTTVIREDPVQDQDQVQDQVQDQAQVQKAVLYSNDAYELLFTPSTAL